MKNILKMNFRLVYPSEHHFAEQIGHSGFSS